MCDGADVDISRLYRAQFQLEYYSSIRPQGITTYGSSAGTSPCNSRTMVRSSVTDRTLFQTTYQLTKYPNWTFDALSARACRSV